MYCDIDKLTVPVKQGCKLLVYHCDVKINKYIKKI